MPPPRRALVLSAGGMFGAYQVGVWRVLHEHFRPDVVIGASIGSLNGWLIASGATPDELERWWLDPRLAERPAYQIPRSPLHGIMDTTGLERIIQEVHADYTPRTEFAVVVTELLKLRPQIFRQPPGGRDAVSWQHLAASCAVLGVLNLQRIDNRVWTDGGLLGALPLWAAADLGATEVVAVHLLPELPFVMKAFGRTARAVARFNPVLPPQMQVHLISPTGLLGAAKDAIFWSERNVRRWFEAGQRDAMQVMASL